MTRLALVVLLAAITGGCGVGSLESARMRGQMVPRGAGEVRDSKRCQALDDEYRTWSGWESAALALTGGSGVSQFPVYLLEPRYQNEVHATLAGVAISSYVFAEYSKKRAATAAETWARECAE